MKALQKDNAILLMDSSTLKNDLSLIKLKDKPFLKVIVSVENKASNKYYTKFETTAKPDLNII